MLAPVLAAALALSCPAPHVTIDAMGSQVARLGEECMFTATADEFHRCASANTQFLFDYIHRRVREGCVALDTDRKNTPTVLATVGDGEWSMRIFAKAGGTPFVIDYHASVVSLEKQKVVSERKHYIRMKEREGWQG